MNFMGLARALVGVGNSFIFQWLISCEPYPLISKLDTVLEIFLCGAQQNGKEEIDQ